MAWTLSFQNDTTTLDLNDGTNYTAMMPFMAPVPQRRTAVGGQNLARHGSDITQRVYNNRAVQVTLLIGGTSQDNLIANINAINSLIERAAEYSVTGLGSQVILRRKWEGATNQVDFHVLDGSLAIGDEFSPVHRINTKIARASLTLVCKPFAYGAEETIENYVQNAGFELSGTALGDWGETKTATGTTTRDTTVKKSGAASMKLVMTDSGGSGQVIERNQTLTDVDAAEVWSFQCWVRVDALSNCKVVMELDYNTGTDVEVSTTTVNASEFVKLTANNNTVPGSVTQVIVRLRLEATAADATGTAYIDNVIAVLASAVPTGWASSRNIGNHNDETAQTDCNYIDFADTGGDVPAELQLLVTEAQAHTEFWSGARHGSQVGDDLWVEGEANDAAANVQAQSGYTFTVNGTSSSSSESAGVARHVYVEVSGSPSTYLAADTYYRLNFDFASPPRGTYRVLAGVRIGESSGGGNTHAAASWTWGMSYTYGDVTLLDDTNPDTASFIAMDAQTISAGNSSVRNILDLGTVTIPPINTPDNMTAATFTLKIFGGWTGGATDQTSANQDLDWYLDFVFLLPNDRGSNYTTKTSGTDVILLDSFSKAKGLYLVDASNIVQSFPSSQLGRSPELHPEGTRIYILAKNSDGHTIADTFTLKPTYRPRFLQVMGA